MSSAHHTGMPSASAVIGTRAAVFGTGGGSPLLTRAVRTLLLVAVLVMTAPLQALAQETYNVVYVRSGGSGDGSSPSKPLGSWAAAYSKLHNTGDRDYDWEHNIIVIVKGYYMPIRISEDDTRDAAGTIGTPATITGVWPWDADGNATVADIKAGGRFRIYESGKASSYIGSATRFRNLLFDGNVTGTGELQSRMSLRLHDALFDTGLVMTNFDNITTGFGGMSGRIAPNFHIQMAYDFDGTATNQPPRSFGQTRPMEVTFRSGRYGRIAVSRAQGAANVTNYVQGTPEKPILAHITVDIQPGNDNSGNTVKSQTYKDDIAIMIGGSSQGFVCADLQFDIKHGTIGTLVAGTQGNNVAVPNPPIPVESFAGRTRVFIGNEGGADDDVTIQTYYGGTQGRAQTTGANASSYFYGQSDFTMHSGSIKAGVFASATAFSGVGDATHHTPDYAIPYVDAGNNLQFGKYNASGRMAVVRSPRGDIDLSTTQFTFNVHGGVIEGGLYGGSKGFEPQVADKYAPDSAGTHYGNTYINVYGGTIKGGVYGGGLGTKEYYDKNPKDALQKVAQVFGDTHVNIYGGNIQGNIYGGGYGIQSDEAKGYEYRPIARVVGSTYVTIAPTDPNWTFDHNVYGGGARGMVEGDTHVTILGGIINGSVFGAGEGEVGHPMKAKVTGNTHVTVGE